MAGLTVFRQLSRLKGVSLTLLKEDSMPSANRMTTPVAVEVSAAPIRPLAIAPRLTGRPPPTREAAKAGCAAGGSASERLFGLGLDAVTDSTRSGVDSRCSGAEHEAARNDRMAVRAEGCREQAADYGFSGHGAHLS
jgi:hypothetical protein